MRVLHLYANSKWTGPADLALLIAQAQRGVGSPGGTNLDPRFAVAAYVVPGLENAVRERARRRSVLEGSAAQSFRRPRHRRAQSQAAVRPMKSAMWFSRQMEGS